jgi:hypothetical protein
MTNLSLCFNLLSRTKPPLGADCEWIVLLNHGTCQGAGRRPNPPSLKENLKKAILDGDERLALKLLEQLSDD